MVYTIDVLFMLFIILTGFSASWIGVELARWAGWTAPVHLDGPGWSAGRVGEFVLTAVLGPRLLLANGFSWWRKGVLSVSVYGLIVVVVTGWSALAGVIVLQLAFASGFFLA